MLLCQIPQVHSELTLRSLHKHYIIITFALGPGHLRAPSEDANSELLQTAMRVASSRVVLDVLGHFLVREAYTCPNACQDPRDT